MLEITGIEATLSGENRAFRNPTGTVANRDSRHDHTHLPGRNVAGSAAVDGGDDGR